MHERLPGPAHFLAGHKFDVSGVLRVMAVHFATWTDGQLLRSARSTPQAFAELYGRYEAIVLGTLMRELRNPELAADLAAETFATALVKAGSFRDDGGPAIGWLLGISRNLLLNWLRKSRNETKARERLGIEHFALSSASHARIDGLLDGMQTNGPLARALARLPTNQQTAVLLYVLGDRTYAELAHELGISEPTARKRVSRGLARLRTALPQGARR